MQFYPAQGDIVYLNFNPQAGHEQDGRRPSLVISNNQFHVRTNLVIVCPISNSNNSFPMHVPLDEKTRTTGFIRCEQIKALDGNARDISYIERVPQNILENVLKIISACF